LKRTAPKIPGKTKNMGHCSVSEGIKMRIKSEEIYKETKSMKGETVNGGK
jgi:hypothetical protein